RAGRRRHGPYGGRVPGMRHGRRHAAPRDRGDAAAARSRCEGRRRHHRSRRRLEPVLRRRQEVRRGMPRQSVPRLLLLLPTVSYPCVLKPLRLAASRGVIRADTPAQFVAAFARVKRILGDAGCERSVLVEDFVPGREYALEGLLVAGELQMLALFDKPDPLDGPYFEETMYVTPSRLPGDTRGAVAACAARAAAALGLREGPVHAELRVNSR